LHAKNLKLLLPKAALIHYFALFQNAYAGVITNKHLLQKQLQLKNELTFTININILVLVRAVPVIWDSIIDSYCTNK